MTASDCPSRTIWLVRHGMRHDFLDASWCDTADRPYDTPLASPDGFIQARETGARLAAEPIDHIFASPFLRAMQTASLIAEAIGLPIKVEAGLCELFFAKWFPVYPELPSLEAHTEQFSGVDPNYRSLVEPIYPEEPEHVAQRGADVMRELTARHAGNLLLVCHGGIIGALARAIVPDRGGSVHCRLCCLIQVVETDDGWELVADGTDASHLSITEETLRLY